MRSANPSRQARRLSLWAGLLWALLPGWASAQAGKAPKATVPPPACERLVQVARALALAGPGTRGRYHCEVQQRTRAGQALALRYRGPEVADGTSNLVGYYEVDRGTQAVHAWDLATGKRAPGALAGGALPPPTVMACGLAFELPVHYRIAKPRRSEEGGVRLCSFDVVPAGKPAPLQLDCKDKDEGGSPPYKVCDWAIGGVQSWPSVQVARLQIPGHQEVGPFVFEEGAWRLPNPYGPAEPVKLADFFGRPAYQGEIIARLSWYRTRTKEFASIHAGTADIPAVLFQLNSALAVVLVNPPGDGADTGASDCTVFCASLRAAGRPGDEP